MHMHTPWVGSKGGNIQLTKGPGHMHTPGGMRLRMCICMVFLFIKVIYHGRNSSEVFAVKIMQPNTYGPCMLTDEQVHQLYLVYSTCAKASPEYVSKNKLGKKKRPPPEDEQPTIIELAGELATDTEHAGDTWWQAVDTWTPGHTWPAGHTWPDWPFSASSSCGPIPEPPGLERW